MLICEQAGDLGNTSNRASARKNIDTLEKNFRPNIAASQGGVVKIRENDMENGDTGYEFQVSAKDVPSRIPVRGPAGWRPVYERLSVYKL